MMRAILRWLWGRLAARPTPPLPPAPPPTPPRKRKGSASKPKSPPRPASCRPRHHWRTPVHGDISLVCEACGRIMTADELARTPGAYRAITIANSPAWAYVLDPAVNAARKRLREQKKRER